MAEAAWPVGKTANNHFWGTPGHGLPVFRLADEISTALLSDPQWWVRYRAAQAIVGLSPRNDQRLRDIHSTLSDRYARDILSQAIAEGAPPGQPGPDLSPTDLSPTGRMRIGAGR